MTNDVVLIEVYCSGSPAAPHQRHYVARMVRTVRMDGTTGWTVARDGGRQHTADQSHDRERFDLRCPACRINALAVVDQTRASRGYERLVRGLDGAAAVGMSELPLHALAGMVSR